MSLLADRQTGMDFRRAYAEQRAREGRRLDRVQLYAVPYLEHGPLARQWSVRARTYEAFMRRVLLPEAARLTRPLRMLDIGAGNGWLCHRAARAGCEATALDFRDDDVDGLGAARTFLDTNAARFDRVAASFESLPVASASVDVAVFNASLHYATDLSRVLCEAHRAVRPGGRLVILDSPFYAHDEHGRAMIAEKRRNATAQFGERGAVLLAPPFIEYLTRDRLCRASEGLHLHWRHWRVRYPLWYECRGLVARMKGRRPPSRFDLWEARIT